ncbi:aldose epimerase family protein [Roseinatronobacter alkalisoli]|uniref:Aldose 1-epimerase n=1 Tax=Roseinatronobacter alkalisoli TaxID=3028235 RepID=A0ABT5T482_9RHOB|nr:aldose epimerase family protein [Roseinatronobacter sp. HJB301]MDD7969926.1 galactose mutarotase [Roseinatronobacter sp. HJB301]
MRTEFGALADGRMVERITLHGGGMVAQVLTLGAIVQDLRMDGVAHPLVLGTDTPDAYLGPMQYFGAIVGRFANRIAGARFELDGHTHHIPVNNAGGHALHGGPVGSSQRLWRVLEQSPASVTLGLFLPDGDMGFPGNLDIRATISLPGSGTLQFNISAQTDRATPCSLTHHGYFALDDTGGLSKHWLRVAADHYLPVDANLIPTGQIVPVADSAFDFRKARNLSGAALDHNFCLSTESQPLRPIAWLQSAESGLIMQIDSTEAGLQVYTGSQIPAAGLPGLGGRCYRPFAGIALEAQAWPDAPNRPAFPSAILRPDGQYEHETRYSFAFADRA